MRFTERPFVYVKDLPTSHYPAGLAGATAGLPPFEIRVTPEEHRDFRQSVSQCDEVPSESFSEALRFAARFCRCPEFLVEPQHLHGNYGIRGQPPSSAFGFISCVRVTSNGYLGKTARPAATGHSAVGSAPQRLMAADETVAISTRLWCLDCDTLCSVAG